MKRFKPAALFALVLAVCTGTLVQSVAQKKEDDSSNLSRWIHSDNDHKRMVEMRGKAEFTEDYTDIVSVTPGGYAKVEESCAGQSQRYEVRSNSGGTLTRIYYRNGKEQTLDQAARDWIAKTILYAVRHAGMDAERRVQIILRQRGVDGVLQEIDLITSDYGKRVYFQGLLKYGNLNTTALQSLLNQAARQISSDYEQAELLIGVSSVLVGKEAAAKALFAAVDTIDSDYEHARVLTTILQKNQVTPTLLSDVAASTRRILSDYEKARVLKEVAKLYLDDDTLRTVYFKVIASIQSDYEHRGVLSALLKKGDLKDVAVEALIESSARMSSDYESDAAGRSVARLLQRSSCPQRTLKGRRHDQLRVRARPRPLSTREEQTSFLIADF